MEESKASRSAIFYCKGVLAYLCLKIVLEATSTFFILREGGRGYE